MSIWFTGLKRISEAHLETIKAQKRKGKLKALSIMKPHCLCYIILLFSLLVGAHCADDDDECVECMECEECKKSEECAECEECEECESEEVQPERGDYEVYDRSGEERNTVYDHTNMKDTGRNGNLDPMKQKVLNMHNEFRRKLNRADVSDLVSGFYCINYISLGLGRRTRRIGPNNG